MSNIIGTYTYAVEAEAVGGATVLATGSVNVGLTTSDSVLESLVMLACLCCILVGLTVILRGRDTVSEVVPKKPEMRDFNASTGPEYTD